MKGKEHHVTTTQKGKGHHLTTYLLRRGALRSTLACAYGHLLEVLVPNTAPTASTIPHPTLYDCSWCTCQLKCTSVYGFYGF